MIKPIKTKLTHRQDDPCYSVGGQVFYSKLDALSRAKELCVTPDPNEIWGHAKFVVYDQHIGPEPQKSLRQLYMERAQQIRQNNEYVRIWASGGTDSTNVLYAFKEAGLMPDEVSTYIQYPGVIDVSQNIEVNTGAREILQQARKWWPDVKFTTYDILPEHYYSYAHEHLDHYYSFTELEPFACNWQMLYEIYPELLEHDKQVQVANIWSGPTLVVGKDEAGWFYRQNDNNYNGQFNAPYQIFFFCDSDSKELTLKILYTMKKRLSNVTDTQFEAHNLSWHDAEMLDYWTTGVQFFSSKERKGTPQNDGLLGRDIKNLLRYNNALLSVMGQKTTLTLWARLNEMSKENPNWFNDNHVLHDWIGLLSPKCYFEKT